MNMNNFEMILLLIYETLISQGQCWFKSNDNEGLVWFVLALWYVKHYWLFNV